LGHAAARIDVGAGTVALGASGFGHAAAGIELAELPAT
jgi:hypothetical protein